MTIQELKEMDLKDYDRICAELETRGFRQAVDDDGGWEFDFWQIWSKSGYREEITKQDEEAGKHFEVVLYKDCSTYEGLTFITLCLSTIEKKGKECDLVPVRKVLFTDAPISEERLRERNSIVKCNVCGKEYARKLLTAHDNKLFCRSCLSFELDSQFTQAMADLVKAKRYT